MILKINENFKKITGLEIYKEYKSIDLRIKGRIYLQKKMFNLKDNPITIFDIGNSKITCLIFKDYRKQNKNPWFRS